MDKDQYWACARLNENGYITDKHMEAVEYYIIFAMKEQWFASGDRIRCPCLKCQKHIFLKHDDVRRHLYYTGFCNEPTSGVRQSSRSRKEVAPSTHEARVENPYAWCDAIGGMETVCTHVYGFRTTPREKNLISPPISIGENSYSSVCSPLVEAPLSTEIDNLREEVAVVKNILQSLVDSQNEIKTQLCRIIEMLNPTPPARNAGFSQIETMTKTVKKKHR